MLFLYIPLHLQVSGDESITLGTREHGVQLNIITGLEEEGRRTKKKKLAQITGKNRKRKSSSATKWTRPRYLLKCLHDTFF